MNNKILGIILGILAIIFASSVLFKSNKNRSFDPNVLTLNKDEVTTLEISLPDNKASIITKKGDDWYVSNESEEYLADKFAVTSILGELESIKAKKVVGRSDAKAESYETNDDKATGIRAKKGGKVIADINIGRFSFDQQSRQPISYVKLSNKDETYLVQSFLAMSLKKDFNSLRDKSLIALKKENINSIKIISPELEEVIHKVEDKWVTSGEKSLDSTSIQNYLDQFTDLKGSTFSEIKSINNPSYILEVLSNEGMQNSIKVEITDDEQFLIQSSTNPQNIFESNDQGIFKKIFSDLIDML